MILDNYHIFGSTITQYVVFLCFIILGFALGKLVYYLTSTVLKAFTSRTKSRLDDIIIDLIDRPLVWLVTLGCFYLGVHFLTLPFWLLSFIDNTIIVLLVLNIAWFVINLVDAIIIYYVKPYAEKSHADLGGSLLPIVRRVVKILLWLIVLIMLFKNIGYDVTALLAGVSIGGLAFALAAQDLLGNLFGGISILTDRPFRVGDRVKVGISDGYVREIGMRSTRIEALNGSMMIVPNSEVAKTTVENMTTKKKEVASNSNMKLVLDHSNSKSKIAEAQKIIKQVISHHGCKDPSVHFSEFTEAGIVLEIGYTIPDSSKIAQVRNDVNLGIKEGLEKAGISFPKKR